MEVEVKVFVGSDAKGFLEVFHGSAICYCPRVIDRGGDVDEIEGDANGIVSCIQRCNLRGGHGLCQGASSSSGRKEVEIRVDSNRRSHSSSFE